MRIPLLSRVIFVLFSVVFSSVNAQKNTEIQFKTGDYIPKDNVNEFVNYPDYNVDELVNGNYYRIIQFSTIPSTQQKEELKNEGIELLNYMPKNAFYASISKTANLNVLLAKNAIAIIFIAPEFKLNRALRDKDYSDWAMIKGNMIEINAIYYSTISEETILTKLQQKGLEVTMSNDANIVRFIVDITELDDIYTQSEFYYFEEIDKPGEPENLVGRSNHRSNTIATEYFGGLKFDGTGVTVMLQDNSKLDQHIDYAGRFTNYPSAIQSGDHGEHCGGIIAGAGNLDPRARGMAFGAEVLVFGASDNNFNDVPTLFANDNLTITSKSYSNGTNAGYTSLAQQLDQQIRTMPELIHIFSAGNGGSGWSTITGGHKQGKNVMAVANLNYKDIITTSSSRGPAADGRIKPDISAVGTNVYSTNDPNNYTYKTGTSMSCPGVAGIMAQLYDAYKSINGGTNPNSALMKAAVLNTGDDLGNAGPDYIYGWGRINARRAYNLFSNNNYVSDAISQGGNNVHSINVPAGTAQLRVMVYWSDYEGSASANPALVNDINMQIVDPAAILFNPWVLNPSSQNNVAARGIDNLNNVEQITIDNPLSGNYTINISGVTIPQGPQEYYVVYELIQNEVVLTYPIGREGFNPGTVETIRWDSYGGTGTFNLEYSTNNGGSWNTINASVSSVLRYYEWTVPSIVSGEVLVRVTRGALSSVSDAVFSIIPTPINLSIDWACPDSMQLSWDIATGAIAYEVSMLGNKYMDSVDVTNANSYVFYGVNPTLSYWVSVRSLGITNARGERALALEKVPGTFGCSILIDAALSSLTPSENAELLDCMIGNNIDVTISIKNEGIASIANIPMHYQLNGGATVNEIYAGPLASGATFNYTFSALVSPTVGTNILLVWSDISGDGNFYNDSVATQFTYAMGTVQNIPWSEDFESFSLCGTLNDCELEICNLSNGFVNEANGSVDDIDWRTDQGGTASMFTGPGDGSDSGQPDFNPGTSSGNYLYLEASSNCNSQRAELRSPCLDLTTAVNPSLIFAYSMYGEDMGSLSLDVYSNGSWINNVMTPLTGNKGTNWLQAIVDLTPFVGGVINLRFRGVTGSGYKSDIVIDDINISEPVSIEEVKRNIDFSIYPNPSNGLYNYMYKGKSELTIKLFDINGKAIYTQNISANSSNKNGIIDITDYTNGIYMVVITTNNERSTQRVIKK